MSVQKVTSALPEQVMRRQGFRRKDLTCQLSTAPWEDGALSHQRSKYLWFFRARECLHEATEVVLKGTFRRKSLFESKRSA